MTFRFRMWLSDQLFALATWVMAEHRWRHIKHEDGTFSFFREAA